MQGSPNTPVITTDTTLLLAFPILKFINCRHVCSGQPQGEPQLQGSLDPQSTWKLLCGILLTYPMLAPVHNCSHYSLPDRRVRISTYISHESNFSNHWLSNSQIAERIQNKNITYIKPVLPFALRMDMFWQKYFWHEKGYSIVSLGKSVLIKGEWRDMNPIFDQTMAHISNMKL